MRIAMSARRMPRAPNDRRVNTCPRNVANTVTDDISIVLAKRAKSVEAVEGAKDPPGCIVWPYLGFHNPITSQSPENTLAYTDRKRLRILGQFALPEYMLELDGQFGNRFALKDQQIKQCNIVDHSP